jgi:hypothetical protein
MAPRSGARRRRVLDALVGSRSTRAPDLFDSWSGLGAVAVSMARPGYDLQLTRYDDKGWRATFYRPGQRSSRHHCEGPERTVPNEQLATRYDAGIDEHSNVPFLRNACRLGCPENAKGRSSRAVRLDVDRHASWSAHQSHWRLR